MKTDNFIKYQISSRSPFILKVVAFILLLSAMQSIFEMVSGFTQGTFTINFGVVGILLFFGLLAHQDYARRLSLLWIGFGIILSLIGTLMLVVTTIQSIVDPLPEDVEKYLSENGMSNNVPSQFLGWSFEIAPAYASILFLLTCVLFIWMWRVLVRPDIKALFNPE